MLLIAKGGTGWLNRARPLAADWGSGSSCSPWLRRPFTCTWRLPQAARFRGAARWVLVAYTALTIVLFFLMAPTYTIIGYVDKAIEVALIALLLADAYAASS